MIKISPTPTYFMPALSKLCIYQIAFWDKGMAIEKKMCEGK